MKRTPLSRKTPLRSRPAPLAGGGRTGKRKQRTASEFARIYGSRARVAWVKSLPCLVCAGTPSENAHTANGGLSRKADADTIVPLCSTHHRRLHSDGVRTFERVYGLDLAEEAVAVEAAWVKRGAQQ